MALELWQRVVSARKPCRFDSRTGFLQLRACSLVDGGDASKLVFASVGSDPLSLACLSAASPCRKIKLIVKDDAVISSSGADVLVTGVLLPADGRGMKRPRAAVEAAPPEASLGKRVVAKSTLEARVAANSTPASPIGTPAIAKAATQLAQASVSAPLANPVEKAVAKAVPANPAKQAIAKSAPAPPAAPVKPIDVSNMSLFSGRQLADLAAEAAAAAAAAACGKKKAERPLLPLSSRILNSGLQYDVLKVGRGAMAHRAAKVTVRYEGKLAKTGHIFDKGEMQFRLGMGEVIRAWDEGIQGMLAGELRRLYVPSRLGYGAGGAPPAIGPGADLIFEVELLER